MSGETGIRTLVTISDKHAFQACAFSHSAISPLRKPSSLGLKASGFRRAAQTPRKRLNFSHSAISPLRKPSSLGLTASGFRRAVRTPCKRLNFSHSAISPLLMGRRAGEAGSILAHCDCRRWLARTHVDHLTRTLEEHHPGRGALAACRAKDLRIFRRHHGQSRSFAPLRMTT